MFFAFFSFPQAKAIKFPQCTIRFLGLRAQFTGLLKRNLGWTDQTERLLAETKLQPQDSLSGIEAESFLQKLQSHGELLVVAMNPSSEPADEPIMRRERERFFEAEIGPFFFAGELDVAASQPNVCARC